MSYVHDFLTISAYKYYEIQELARTNIGSRDVSHCLITLDSHLIDPLFFSLSS